RGATQRPARGGVSGEYAGAVGRGAVPRRRRRAGPSSHASTRAGDRQARAARAVTRDRRVRLGADRRAEPGVVRGAAPSVEGGRTRADGAAGPRVVAGDEGRTASDW